MELFKLFGTVLVDTDKAEQSIQKTTQKSENLGKKMGDGIKKAAKWGAALGAAAVGVGTSMMVTANKVAANADEIDKMSQKLGMSREAYQEWDYVLSQSGVDINSMETGMKTLTNQIGKCKDETSFASSAFADLGMSYDDVKGKSREEVFAESIKALQDCQDETKRATLANKLFGKSGQNMAPLLAEGSASTEELIQKAHELGLVMSDEAIDAGVNFTDTMDSLKRAGEGLFNTIGADLLPIVTDFANWLINEGIPKVQEWKEKFQDLIDKIGNAIDKVGGLKNVLIPLAGIIGTVTALVIAYNVQQALATAGTTLWGAVCGVATAATTALGAAFTFLTSPIGLIIIAIGAVVTAGVLLYKNWDVVKEKASQLWGYLKEKFGKIKEAITGPIETAKEKVKDAIDKIKGFFNFNWEFPKLKMPHFKVEGSANPLKWLDEGVPKLSVEWYAKGGIMNNPTAFGVNGNNIMVGGESGAEAIAPLSKLEEYYKKWSSNGSENNDLLLSQLIDRIDNLIELAKEGQTLSINGRAFALATAGDVSYALQQLEKKGARL